MNDLDIGNSLALNKPKISTRPFTIIDDLWCMICKVYKLSKSKWKTAVNRFFHRLERTPRGEPKQEDKFKVSRHTCWACHVHLFEFMPVTSLLHYHPFPYVVKWNLMIRCTLISSHHSFHAMSYSFLKTKDVLWDYWHLPIKVGFSLRHLASPSSSFGSSHQLY